jgi:H+/Cl- antiporter ClcA
MCISYGTNIPAGLFLPGVIVGCAMGDLVFIAGDAINIFPG